MSLRLFKKVFAGIVSASIILSGINVWAQNDTIDILLSCNNGVQLADQLSALTSEELKDLGINSDIYKLYKSLQYPKYVGLKLLESGFKDSAELRTAFDKIVNDMVYSRKYTVEDYNDIISFRKEAGIANKGRGTSVIWGDTAASFSGKSLGIVPFTIENSYAVLSGTIQTRSNGTSVNNASRIKGYTTEPMPVSAYEKWGFDITNTDWKTTTHRNFEYVINNDTKPNVSASDNVYTHMGFSENDVVVCWKEIYDMWCSYQDSLTMLPAEADKKMDYTMDKENNAVIYPSNTVALQDSIIADLNKKENSDLVLALGADNNNAVLILPKTVLTFVYDKTAEWEHALTATPAHDEVEVFGASEMILESKNGFDFVTVVNDNFYVCKNDKSNTPVEYYVEARGDGKAAVCFMNALELGTEYIVGMKNLKDQNSVSIQNREIRFTTSKIYQNIDIEFENVLSLGIDMPIQLTAYLGDGTGENMPWNKVLISNNTFQFENGKFKATDYGKDIITVKHTNKANGVTLEKGVVAVAPAKADIKRYNEYVYGSVNMLQTAYADFVAEGWFYDDLNDTAGENSVKLVAGQDITLGIDTSISKEHYVFNGQETTIKRTKGAHQAAFMIDTAGIFVYIDGQMVGELTYTVSGVSSIGAAGTGDVRFGKFGIYFIRDTAPVIRGLTVKNKNSDYTAYLGGSIKAEWEYYDAENDQENGTVSGWYMADTPNGKYELISNESEVQLGNQHFDKWLKFIITPKNDYAAGTDFETEPIHIILCHDAQTALKLINYAEIYEMDDILSMYGDVLGIADDLASAKKNISDMNFVYAKLQYKNFDNLEELQSALQSAVKSYAKTESVYCTNFVVNEKTITEGLVDYEFKNAPGYTWNANIQNVTGNDAYLTFKNITNVDAIKNIQFQYATSNIDTTYNNIITEFSGYSFDKTPEGFVYDEWIQYDFNMHIAKDRQYHHQEFIRYDVTDYVLDSLTEGGEMTVKLRSVATGAANVYLPSAANEYQRPQLVITYDMTKIQKKECISVPDNFEINVAKTLDTYKFNWEQTIDMLTWNEENVKFINCETGERVYTRISSTDTEINILETLSPLTMYCAEISNVKDIDGTVLDDYQFYFITEGEYDGIQVYADTAIKLGSHGQIITKGICGGKEYVILSEELSYTSSDDTVAQVAESGEIITNKRGTAVITVNYQNIFEQKFIVVVYHTADKFTFETDERRSDELKYQGKYALKIDDEYTIMNEVAAQLLVCWFYDSYSADNICQLSAGGVVIGMAGENPVYRMGSEDTAIERTKGWHQLVADNSGEIAAVYIDGILAAQVSDRLDALKVDCQSGVMYIDSCAAAAVTGTVCEARNVTLRGSGYTGSQLEGSYIYYDADQDMEFGSKYAWYVSNTESGPYSPIPGEKNITFTPSISYQDKYIKFAVTPENINETGDIYYSSAKRITAYKAGGSGTGTGNSNQTVNSTAAGNGITSVGFMTPDTVDDTKPVIFKDLAYTHWAYDDILALYNMGLIRGRTDTEFAPQENITRAEFTTLLVLALGIKILEYKPIFHDVSGDDWYCGYVIAGYENNIISGNGLGFAPNTNITRQEMAVMIMNAYEMAAEEIVGVQPPEISDDAQIDEWAKDSVYKAYHTELLSGMESGGFAPKENATRAQAAAVIKRFVDKIK